MATKAELLAQGKTEQQIQDAIVARNTAAMGQKLGQTLTPTSYAVKPTQDIGGLSSEQAQRIQDVNKANLAKGMSAGQSIEAIRADKNFANAKAQYNTPVATTTTPTQTTTAQATPPAQTTQEQNLQAMGKKLGQEYDSTTGQFKPSTTAQATTTPPTQETPVKTQTNASIDYNSAVGREDQITNNVNNIIQQNPALATDRAKYDQAFGYATADAGKKAILDSFFQKGQAEQKRQATLNKYGSYSPAQFESLISSGTLLPGSDDYNALSSDPNMKAKIDKANLLRMAKNEKIDTTKAGETLTTEVLDNNPSVANALNSGDISPEEFAQLTRFEGQEAMEAKLRTKQDELTKKQSVYDNIEQETRKQYAGTGMSETMLARIIANARKEMLPELKLSMDLYNNEFGAYTEKRKEALGLFDVNLKQYNADKETSTRIEADRVNFERQKEMAQFQQDLGLKGDQAKFEQQMKQKAAIASDPILATQDVIDTYKKMGILAGRSDAEIIQSVQNDIASGMTLGQSLTSLNKAFQSKDAYKALTAPKTTTQPQVWSKLNDTTLYNQATGEQKSVSALTKGASATDLMSVPNGTIIPSRLGEVTNPNGGKECAEFINDVTKLGMGDTYASKVAKTNTQIASEAGVGNVAVWNPNPKDPTFSKYGHAGIITKDLGDSWEIMSSNLKGDGAISRDVIPKKSIYSYNTEKKVEVPTGGVMGSAGVPLSYQRRIEQMVPVQLRNSDAESEKLLADIKNMQQAGLSPEDATLMYLGFNLTDPNKKSETMKLVSQARGLGESLPEDFFIKVSDYVNNGNMAGAKAFTDRVVEGTLKKQLGDEFISTPNIKFAESTLSRIENLINRNKDQIGPLSGRIADVEKKLVNDPDYQALKTLLSGSLADTRRAFGGTAVSQSELDALKDFIGLSTTMPIENLLSGLRTNFETLTDKYQQQRGFYLGEENTQPTKQKSNTDIQSLADKYSK